MIFVKDICKEYFFLKLSPYQNYTEIPGSRKYKMVAVLIAQSVFDCI